jgi:hypothetical protein
MLEKTAKVTKTKVPEDDNGGGVRDANLLYGLQRVLVIKYDETTAFVLLHARSCRAV